MVSVEQIVSLGADNFEHIFIGCLLFDLVLLQYAKKNCQNLDNPAFKFQKEHGFLKINIVKYFSLCL